MAAVISGERIRALRKRLGLSQVELAALLGVSNVTVNRWEHDRALPEPATIARLLRAEVEGIESLRASNVRLSNLPTPSTPILGRNVDIAALLDLISREPLVTLLGTGGVGKTRLAVEAGRALTGRFPDGVWFVDLSPLTIGDEVVYGVAQVLGVREAGRRPLIDRVVAELQERRLLLILDNCEHLITACAEFCRRCLSQSTELRMLATGRIPLGLAQEATLQIAPLQPPDATALFVQRASAHHPDFDLNATESDSVISLCRRLDGLPLAIELAASRTHVLTVEQISDRLDRRFELLRTSRDAPPRQQALETAIGWSYDLLEPAEAALFRRLGVFAGTFDLQSVEAVFGGDALDLLDHLARQSLIVVEFDARSKTARYRLLESIAAYARHELHAHGEADEAAHRHVGYYLELVNPVAEELRGPKQSDLLALLDRELANLLAALEWTIAHGNAEQAVSLAAALAPYWHRRSRFSDGRAWLQRALALPGTAAFPGRISALIGFATLSTWTGAFEEAEAVLDEAVSLARASENRTAEADALDVLGVVARGRGEIDRAQANHEASLAICEEIGYRRGAATSRSNLGLLANIRGDHQVAERLYLEAWSLIHGVSDASTEAAILANLGEVAARTGRSRDAAAYFERTLTLLREIGDPDRIAIIATNAAELKAYLGETEDAVALATEAVAQFRRLGNRVQLAGAIYVQGISLAATPKRGSALSLLREALAHFHLLGNWVDAAQTVEAIAGLFIAAGVTSSSARWLGGAEALREREGVDPYPMFDYAGTVAAVRSLMEEVKFRDAWEAGRRLSPEQLIAEVLHLGQLTDRDEPRREPAATPIDSRSVSLTGRQIDVLRLVAAGRSNREAARELGISERTVERHLTAIFGLLGADRRSAAVATAVSSGLLNEPQD